VPRLLSTLLVLGLLGGTAAAFAVTERLKLVPSPIETPFVTEAFSPVCNCPTGRARIEFTLRHEDRLTVTIVDTDGDEVATIADGVRYPAARVGFSWNGRGAPEGIYRARVHFDEGRRTIEIPEEIRLDVTPPRLAVRRVAPTVFSPDRDGRSDKVSATYAVSERASVALDVDGRDNVVVTPPRTAAGKIDWYARGFEPGLYAITLRATDVAGNRSEPTVPNVVRLRFITLAPRRLVVPAGVRFGVRVSTDALRYGWRFGARRGTSRAEQVILRAPLRPGRYTFTASYGDHRDAIPVFVRPRP